MIWKYKIDQLHIFSVPHVSPNETNTRKLHLRARGNSRANCKSKFVGENVSQVFLLRRYQFISLRSNSTWCYGYSDSGIRVFDQEWHPTKYRYNFFPRSIEWNFEFSNIFPDEEGLIFGFTSEKQSHNGARWFFLASHSWNNFRVTTAHTSSHADKYVYPSTSYPNLV